MLLSAHPKRQCAPLTTLKYERRYRHIFPHKIFSCPLRSISSRPGRSGKTTSCSLSFDSARHRGGAQRARVSRPNTLHRTHYASASDDTHGTIDRRGASSQVSIEGGLTCSSESRSSSSVSALNSYRSDPVSRRPSLDNSICSCFLFSATLFFFFATSLVRCAAMRPAPEGIRRAARGPRRSTRGGGDFDNKEN